MSEILLVKTTDSDLLPEDAAAMNRVLFGGYVDGMGDKDKASWKRFWGRIRKTCAGEVVKVSFKLERNGKFHRKFFALLNVGFEAWDPGRKHKTYQGVPVAKSFERFRKEVTILAGYYEQTFDLDGNMTLDAQSISFASMSQEEFEELYSAVVNVLLDKVLSNYRDREELDEVVNKVMGFV
jgi:hypothetical protein